jgi:hypothetical protein
MRFWRAVRSFQTRLRRRFAFGYVKVSELDDMESTQARTLLITVLIVVVDLSWYDLFGVRSGVRLLIV